MKSNSWKPITVRNNKATHCDIFSLLQTTASHATWRRFPKFRRNIVSPVSLYYSISIPRNYWWARDFSETPSTLVKKAIHSRIQDVPLSNLSSNTFYPYSDSTWFSWLNQGAFWKVTERACTSFDPRRRRSWDRKIILGLGHKSSCENDGLALISLWLSAFVLRIEKLQMTVNPAVLITTHSKRQKQKRHDLNFILCGAQLLQNKPIA
jgi:hypothetical protein